MSFFAGAAIADITPSLDSGEVYLAGFDDGRIAEQIGDLLSVRSTAFSDGRGEPIVITSCDLIGLTRVPGAKGSRVVACTHTHHGPDTLGFWGRPLEGVTGRRPDYDAFVRETIAETERRAVEALRPAQLKVASTDVDGLLANFRDAGLVDEEMSVVRAEAADGEVIFTVVGYPCHPEVIAPDQTAVSSDFAGALCRALDDRCGGVTSFVAGCLGGMLSPSTEIRSSVEADRYGRVLADAVTSALESAAPDPEPLLAFARKEITSELENPLYLLAMEMGIVPQAEMRDGRLVTEVSVVRLGRSALACVPGELFPKLGLALKQSMRRRGVGVPFIVGLADDELGYLLPEEDFVEPTDYLDPGAQYEESFSPGRGIGPAVCDALEDLFEALLGSEEGL